MASGLTLKQQRLAERHVAGDTGLEAARFAGYSGSDNNLMVMASTTLSLPKVRAYIAELRKPETKAAIKSKDAKLKFLASVIEGKDFKMGDRLRAVDIANRMAGHYEAEKVVLETGDNTLAFLQDRAKEVMSGLNKFTSTPPTQ